MLWKGEGVPVDEQEAARWWLKGAQAGHVTAMVDLAYTYREGRGNAKDLAEALRWYQAASNSSRDAQYQYVGLAVTEYTLAMCDDVAQAGQHVQSRTRRAHERGPGIRVVPKGRAGGMCFGV